MLFPSVIVSHESCSARSFSFQRLLDERDQQVMALSQTLTERNDELAVLRAARAMGSSVSPTKASLLREEYKLQD